MKKIVAVCSTVGPAPDSVIGKNLLEQVKYEPCPNAVKNGSVAWWILEDLGLLEEYQALKKDKIRYLQEVWESDIAVATRFQIELDKLSVDPLYARLNGVCVTVDGEPMILSEKPNSADVLEDFLRIDEISPAYDNVWLGHRFSSYDMPVLLSTMARNGCVLPRCFPVPERIRNRDMILYDVASEAHTSETKVDLSKLIESYAVGVADAPMPSVSGVGEYLVWKAGAITQVAKQLSFGWELVIERIEAIEDDLGI